MSAELAPPWIEYPDRPPWWGGWRQGESEHWLHNAWLPFWKALSEEGRSQYIDRWQPSPEWKEYLLVHWR